MTPGQRAGMQHLIDGLGGELESWRRLAEGDRAPLAKHHSQLRAVVAMLNEGLDQARSRLAADDGAGLPVLILDLHHVWDYFRAKFTLRRLDGQRPVLEAADELAWTCYRGPLAAALTVDDRAAKEPPLVSYSRDAVPRAHPRGGQYRDLLPRGGVHTRQGVALVRRLPFPVIDVPWYYASHLPALLTVAHEVGHHVEDDFALTPELRARLASADLTAAERPVWEGWLGEVFADVCASVACGLSYPAVLADVVAGLRPAGPDDDVAPGPSAHPPPGVRVRVCLAALERAGHPRPPAWPQPLAEALEGEPADDAAPAEVVAALLTDGYAPLGGKRLTDLLALDSPQALPERAELLLAGVDTGCRQVTGVLGAAALAFMTDPTRYDDFRVGPRALEEVLALRPVGVRHGRTDDARHEDRDTEAGRLLLDALTTPNTPDQPL
ncbi:hypothetical protein ACYF6T_22415 [Streptomyces sp. 7R007]